jgi:hypothetical protein
MSPVLRRKIAPATTVSKARIEKLIADLDSDQFVVRETATKSLVEAGEPAVPALEMALKGQPSLETRRRLERLRNLLQGEPSPDKVRRIRAVQALELAGTPEACSVLRAWAGGAAGHHLTEGARAALARQVKRR